MDNFEQRLKDDASDIRVHVSAQLEDRIRASLENAVVAEPREATRVRPAWFWLASSLTGAAAAAVLLVIVNTGEEALPNAPAPSVASVQALAVPKLDVRPAMVAPFEVELQNLKGDLEKAEQIVRQDLDRILGEAPP